jgi:hypothetical protein
MVVWYSIFRSGVDGERDGNARAVDKAWSQAMALARITYKRVLMHCDVPLRRPTIIRSATLYFKIKLQSVESAVMDYMNPKQSSHESSN